KSQLPPSLPMRRFAVHSRYGAARNGNDPMCTRSCASSAAARKDSSYRQPCGGGWDLAVMRGRVILIGARCAATSAIHLLSCYTAHTDPPPMGGTSHRERLVAGHGGAPLTGRRQAVQRGSCNER